MIKGAVDMRQRVWKNLHTHCIIMFFGFKEYRKYL